MAVSLLLMQDSKVYSNPDKSRESSFLSKSYENSPQNLGPDAGTTHILNDIFVSHIAPKMTEQHFQKILEAIHDPAILLDRNYRICATNRAYTDTYGPTALGRHCYEISHDYDVPCDQAGEDCPLKNCITHNSRQRVLHIHNTASGKEHIDVELTPIHDENGQITHFVEIMHHANATRLAERKMLGFSQSFNQMLELLNRAAASNISVLLQGETGSGKELAAHYLHEHSPRAQKPFVIVECSGLSESLFESELFGHEKGAFTGATSRKTGLVEAAEGGTLFLDEIGDIPLPLQVKLLRLLETGKFRRVGGITEQSTDFRLVCATHKHLQEMVHNGEFRQDLYYRICPFPVVVPSLRERQEDITLIAKHLLYLIAPERKLTLSGDAQQFLKQQSFPGNIRELRNLMERASILCDHSEIQLEHLVSPLSGPTKQSSSAEITTLAAAEKAHLEHALQQCPDDNGALARQLGISERTLYRKLKKLQT